MYDIPLLYILSGLVVLSVFSVRWAIRLGSYGGTEPVESGTYARPPPELDDADADLVAQLKDIPSRRARCALTQRR